MFPNEFRELRSRVRESTRVAIGTREHEVPHIPSRPTAILARREIYG